MKVFLVRCNGAIVRICSTEESAVAYMKANRKNSEFWRIHPHEVHP